MAEAAASSRVPASSVIASEELFSIQRAKILFRANESARPATMALLTLIAVAEMTMRSRCPARLHPTEQGLPDLNRRSVSLAQARLRRVWFGALEPQCSGHLLG